LANLVNRSSGYIESLPLAVRERVDALKGLQVEQQTVESEYQHAILELEKKFAEKFAPIYDRRARIVAGAEEPPTELIDLGRQQDEDEDDDEEDEEPAVKVDQAHSTPAEKAAAPKGIPEFWLSALKNHMGISEMITERDEEVLKHLTDIRVAYLDRPGFKLVFSFGEGAKEFFSNQTLEKTYLYQDEVGYEGDFVYDHADGTKIDWKSGKNLTVRVETKRQRNKNTHQTRTVKKEVPAESFFDFFSPPNPPSEDDEDAEDGLDEKLEMDYQMGEDLKDRIVSRAVDYFTGKALRYDHDLEDIESDEFADEAVEDEDDEEEDEEEEPQARGGPRHMRPPPAMGVTPASNQDPQECKQS